MSQEIVQNTSTKAVTGNFDALAPLSSKALFWRANYLEKSTFLDHIPLLFWTIEQARPTVIVSLGITDAVPYFAACQAIEKLNIEAICFAVEPESDTNLGAVLEYNKRHFNEFSEIAIDDPSTLATKLGNAEIDLLIVNQPLTQALADEIDSLWLSLLSDSTLILFTQGGDAKIFDRYADRLAKDGDIFTVTPAQGVHLVLRGTRHNDRLTRLGRLKPGNPGYLNVKQIFSRIGELHRTSYEGKHTAGVLTKTRKQRDDAVKGLEDKTNAHDAVVTKVARLSEYLKTATDQIAISRAEAFDDKTLLEAVRKELADTRTMADGLHHTIATLETAIAQRDTKLAELTTLLDQQEQQHKSQTKDLSEAMAEADTLAATLEQEAENLRSSVTSSQEALAKAISERDAAIAETSQRYTELVKLTNMLEQQEQQQNSQKPVLAASAKSQEEAKKLYVELAILTRTLEEREQHQNQQAARLSEYQNTIKQQEQALATAARDLAQTKALHDRARLHHRMIMQLSAAKDEISAVLHGNRMSKKHRALRSDLDQQVTLVTKSGLFDAKWYSETYPDITASRLSPVAHFVQLGAYEARNPGPDFDSVKYHMADPLIAANKMPALLHYLRHGKEEGRPIFAVKS